MKILPILALSAVLCLALARAQPVEQPATFRVISSVGSYGELFYDASIGGKRKPVAITLNQSLSAPLAWPAKSPLEIYRLVPPPPGAPEGSKPTRQIVVSIPLPAENDPIVVTFPTSDDRLAPLAAHIVPPTPDTHKAGTVKVINFSKFNTAVGMDARNDTLKPGGISVFPTGTGRVLFQVAVGKGNNWASAFRGERRLSPKVRGYVFVFNYVDDPDYGREPTPPPATVKTFFEVSPETITPPALAQR